MSACLTCGSQPCINPQFCALCRGADARKARGERPRYSTPDHPIDWSDSPHLAFLRRMMDPAISLERASYEINRAAREKYNEAPPATWKAAQYELRTYGLPQLSNPNCQRRLSDLSIAQLKNLIACLHQRRGQYPNISDELLSTLATIYDARVMSNGQ
jgi:hypothetical protein